MKSLVVYIFILYSVMQGIAQCPNGTTSFNTQQEIDNFIIQYPNCTQLQWVSISGNDIINMSGLINVSTISGRITISYSPLLTDWSGLNNLEYVGENLIIHNMPNLIHLNGFTSLEEAQGILIYQCDSLISVGGFNSLDSVGRLSLAQLPHIQSAEFGSSIHIQSCDMSQIGSGGDFDGFNGVVTANTMLITQCYLSTMSGFQQLVALDSNSISQYNGYLDINFVDIGTFDMFNNLVVLESIYLTGTIDLFIGMKALKTINALLYVEGNIGDMRFPSLTMVGDGGINMLSDSMNMLGDSLFPKLTIVHGGIGITYSSVCEISGFNALEYCEGRIAIGSNDELKYISGFNQLDSTASLIIFNNPELRAISAFSNVQRLNYPFGTNKLNIWDNPKLFDCTGVCSVIGTLTTSEVYFVNNLLGCNTKEEVNDTCDGCLLMQVIEGTPILPGDYVTENTLFAGGVVATGDTIHLSSRGILIENGFEVQLGGVLEVDNDWCD